MKGLLFLDFDGVLNRILPPGSPDRYEPKHPGLDPALVWRAAELAERFDLGVLVSSSWRKIYSDATLRGLLAANREGSRLAGRVVGSCCILEDERPSRRGREVALTLRKFPGLPYVIIDDAKNHGFLPEHFVRTDGLVGLSVGDATACAAILCRQGLAPV